MNSLFNHQDWAPPLLAWAIREVAGVIKRRIQRKYSLSVLDLAERYIGVLGKRLLGG